MSLGSAAVGCASWCDTEDTGVILGHTVADCILEPLLLLVRIFKSHH